MYADRVACCPLVSHVEYAPRALFRSEKDAARPIIIRKNGTDRQTDGRQTETLCIPTDAASAITLQLRLSIPKSSSFLAF